MHRRLVVVLLALVTALALGGCSNRAETSRSDAPATTSSGPAATRDSSSGEDQFDAQRPTSKNEANAEVPEVLRFEATALDGSTFDGSSLAGKPTVFWFWAPWCPTCRGQIPDVEAVAAQYAGDVNVVGVGGLDSDSAIQDFAAELDGMTLLVDDEGAVWQRFGITEQSSFVILDAGGQEVTKAGYGDDIDLSAEVDGLLN